MYNQYQSYGDNQSFLTKFLIRIGIAKNAQQAQMVSLFISVVCIIACILFDKSTRTAVPPVTQEQIDAVFKNTPRPIQQ